MLYNYQLLLTLMLCFEAQVLIHKPN